MQVPEKILQSSIKRVCVCTSAREDPRKNKHVTPKTARRAGKTRPSEESLLGHHFRARFCRKQEIEGLWCCKGRQSCRTPRRPP